MYDESTTQLMALANLMNVKDSRWLQLEVCREFQRGQCSRTEHDCKFSHPPPHVEIQNGRVTACYDSIKGRCTRENPKCKYLHPPQHLKDQLLINGRNNLAIKNLLMNQFTTPAVTAPLTINPLAVAGNAAVMSGMTAAYNPFAAAYTLNPTATMYPNLVASPDVLGSMGGVLQVATTPVSMAAAMASLQAQKSLSTNNSITPNNRSDRVEVCRDHLRGACPRSADDCKFAHPDPAIVQKNGGCSDGMITVCMDYVLKNGACTRENCRYFHPPPHLTLKSSSSLSSWAINANGHTGNNNGNNSSGSQSRDETSSSPMTTSSSAMQQPTAMSATVAVAQALAARAAAANAALAAAFPAAAFPHAAFPTAAAYQSLLAASTQSQMAAARNFVVNQACLQNAASSSTAAAAAALMANRGGTIVTNDGHANPKKRAFEIDNSGYSTTDPYLLAAAQALSSTASAKRAAFDKSGMPFYQPTITAAAYPFNLQQYQQLAPVSAAIPTLPGASYFPAAAFTPPFFLHGGNMAASAASMVFNMPVGSTFMMSDVLPLEQHASYNSSVAPKVPVNLAAVAYYDETGQLLDTLPVCRDFKQGHCDRPSCRYVHLYEDYVEISDGKVTVCRDFAKGKCIRSTCKYYHIPLFFNHSLQSSSDTVNATIIPNSTIQATPINHQLPLCQSTNPLVYQVLQQDNHLGDVLYNQSS